MVVPKGKFPATSEILVLKNRSSQNRSLFTSYKIGISIEDGFLIQYFQFYSWLR